MKKIIKLDNDEIRMIIATIFDVPKSAVTLEMDAIHHEVSATIRTDEKTDFSLPPEAYWEFWPGWVGNHDKRIDDAKCSNCGFRHPTVRGVDAPKQLYKVCPNCCKKMGYREK